MRGEHPSLTKGFTFSGARRKAALTEIRSLFRPKARERFVVGLPCRLVVMDQPSPKKGRAKTRLRETLRRGRTRESSIL
jgi:hypothetical protein